MPIESACACGKRFMAKDELAGKTVNCPSCGDPFVVPIVMSAAPAAPPATANSSMSPLYSSLNVYQGGKIPTPTLFVRRKSSIAPVLVAFAIAGLAGLGVLGGGVVSIVRASHLVRENLSQENHFSAPITHSHSPNYTPPSTFPQNTYQHPNTFTQPAFQAPDVNTGDGMENFPRFGSDGFPNGTSLPDFSGGAGPGAPGAQQEPHDENWRKNIYREVKGELSTVFDNMPSHRGFGGRDPFEHLRELQRQNAIRMVAFRHGINETEVQQIVSEGDSKGW